MRAACFLCLLFCAACLCACSLVLAMISFGMCSHGQSWDFFRVCNNQFLSVQMRAPLAWSKTCTEDSISAALWSWARMRVHHFTILMYHIKHECVCVQDSNLAGFRPQSASLGTLQLCSLKRPSMHASSGYYNVDAFRPWATCCKRQLQREPYQCVLLHSWYHYHHHAAASGHMCANACIPPRDVHSSCCACAETPQLYYEHFWDANLPWHLTIGMNHLCAPYS